MLHKFFIIFSFHVRPMFIQLPADWKKYQVVYVSYFSFFVNFQAVILLVRIASLRALLVVLSVIMVSKWRTTAVKVAYYIQLYFSSTLESLLKCLFLSHAETRITPSNLVYFFYSLVNTVWLAESIAFSRQRYNNEIN